MSVLSKTLWVLACLGLGSARGAGPAVVTAFSMRESYDDNIYLQDDVPLAAGQTRASLPANAGAIVTAAGASVSLGWQSGPALQVELAYAPEVFRFSRFTTENHTDHRFTASAGGTEGDWRYEAKASWLGTVGSRESPVFNRLGGSPPVGGEPVRARRSQDITKVNGRLTRVFPHGFVRGVLALNNQDFHTRERTTYGCANYVDRAEWAAGPELGGELRTGFFAVAAIRAGRQQQANLLGVSLNYTNTLTRWLAGAEGQLARHWKLSVLAGPDVRTFGPAVRSGFDRHQTTTYWEGNATWTPTDSDTLTLSGRRCLWLPSGGRNVYVDLLYDLSWKHRFSPEWSAGTGLNQHLANTGRYSLTSPRDEAITGASCAITFAMDSRTKLDFGVAQDWSNTAVPDTPSRVYHRRIGTIGCTRRW